MPGDERGWVKPGKGWQLPDPIREFESKALMTDVACRLSHAERAAVEAQIAETCAHRGWHLHAANCRSNHVHVVVSAHETAPRKIRIDLKAWATRCLKEQFDPGRQHWWADRGSIRFLYGEKSLEMAVTYVVEAQDRKGRDQL